MGAAQKLLTMTGQWIIMGTSMPRTSMSDSRTNVSVCALTEAGFVFVTNFSTDTDHGRGTGTPANLYDFANCLIYSMGDLPDVDNPLGHVRKELDRLAKLVLAR